MDMMKKTAIAAFIAAIALPAYAHSNHHNDGRHYRHHDRVVVVNSDHGYRHHRHGHHHRQGYWVPGHWKDVKICGSCRKCGCYWREVWVRGHWVRW